MALSVHTNIASLSANRHLMKATSNMGKTFEKLSSGFRINSAKDDAAGLAISTRMTAQVRGLNQAVRNTNDAISLVQVAEGALNETTNALQRMRELAVQSNNATMTGKDQNALMDEVVMLMSEIERIATTTEFNNKNLIDGTFSAKKFQVGADAGETLSVSITDADAFALGLSTGTGLATVMSIGSGAHNGVVGTGNVIGNAITKIDTALDSVSDMRASLGSYQNRFESLMAGLSNVSENTAAARGRIVDADIANETANLTKNAIMQQAGTAILAQANQQPQIALQLLG
jgi:flagellin